MVSVVALALGAQPVAIATDRQHVVVVQQPVVDRDFRSTRAVEIGEIPGLDIVAGLANAQGRADRVGRLLFAIDLQLRWVDRDAPQGRRLQLKPFNQWGAQLSSIRGRTIAQVSEWYWRRVRSY